MVLSACLKNRVNRFIEQNDLKNLYMNYNWDKDNWLHGFPYILMLELKLREAAKNNLITRNHLLLIAEWGKLRNPGRIRCPQAFSFRNTQDDIYARQSVDEFIDMIKHFRLHVKGFGPTYMSKLIRFAFPLSAGAIDTRIVRCFGFGDERNKKYDWLELRVRNDGYGWYIPQNQSGWPKEYGRWLSILSYFCEQLNESSIICPHPVAFVKNGLRHSSIWSCSDVEMALFTYASLAS